MAIFSCCYFPCLYSLSQIVLATTGDRPDIVAYFLQECAAALVFFKTRYAALVASQGLQSPNPMLWATDLAPEPEDMYWANICVPYKLHWIRKIAMHVASVCFVIFFLVPVSVTQGLVHLDKLQKTFPSLRLMQRYYSPLPRVYTLMTMLYF